MDELCGTVLGISRLLRELKTTAFFIGIFSNKPTFPKMDWSTILPRSSDLAFGDEVDIR